MLNLRIWTTVVLIVTANYAKAELKCQFVGALRRDLNCITDDNVNVNILSRGVVSDNNRTASIDLRECKLTEIKNGSLSGLFGLKSLDLSNNKIENLEVGVLDEIKGVTSINVSHNELKYLNLGLFDRIPKLAVLDLKGNKIEDVKQGLFDALKLLKHLDLSQNMIVGNTLSPYVFDKTKSIEFMDFSKNDMSEAPENLLIDLNVLDTLILDGCYLTDIPEFSRKRNLETLKTLILSSNLIKNLDDVTIFKNLINLEVLDLSQNEIVTINDNVFKSLKKLRILSLRYNKIKELSDGVFRNMEKLGNIDLSHNEIEIVPINAFRGAPLKNLNLANNKFTYLIDNFCLELKNTGAKLTKFYFHQNPWQCPCLLQFLKEVKNSKIEYNSLKYNGEEPVCVSDREFSCKRHKSDNDNFITLYENNVHL